MCIFTRTASAASKVQDTSLSSPFSVNMQWSLQISHVKLVYVVFGQGWHPNCFHKHPCRPLLQIRFSMSTEKLYTSTNECEKKKSLILSDTANTLFYTAKLKH